MSTARSRAPNTAEPSFCPNGMLRSTLLASVTLEPSSRVRITSGCDSISVAPALKGEEENGCVLRRERERGENEGRGGEGGRERKREEVVEEREKEDV